MRYAFQLVGFICAAVAALAAGPANAERRVALVIGNAAYKAVVELPNPRKDARDVAAALKAAQFAEVVERYDLGIQQMRDALAAFEDKATGADWAVVYYAGHGIEVDGRNYLVPVDAQLKRATDVEDETLPLDRVLARMAAAGKLQLVILDACRFNPFKQRMAGAGTRIVGERGLARIEPTHPNVVVAYAARDGQVALDGKPGENSPYARALLKYLAEPGLELGNMFRKMRDEVLAETGGRQRPYEYGSLTSQQLFFKPGAAAGPKPGAISPPPPQLSEAERAWAAVKDSTSVAALEAFRRQYGAANAFYDRLAEARSDELRRQQLALLKAEEDKRRAEAEKRRAEEEWKRAEADLTPGRVFRDCDVCPEMVVVPAGSFLMGSPAGEKDREANEGPQHRVTIARPFAVGKFDVTFAEWDACVAAGGCKHSPSDTVSRRLYNFPVINVSWDDVTNEYLPWLSRKTGKTYRLLTEAEWEYAARAGTTAPTGRKVNDFGLHDMQGNGWVWVQDCWNKNYNGAPTDGSAWTTGNCSLRVHRGSWGASPGRSRFAYRTSYQREGRSEITGFRLGRTL